MTDPITSQYDQHPFDPDDHSHDNDPSPDLGNTDSPELKVAWDTHPSFNLGPKDISEGQTSGDPSSQDSGDANDFQVGFDALGTQVNAMLGTVRGLVTQYEDLRTKVMATGGTVFGQTSMRKGADPMTYDSFSHQWYPNSESSQQPSPTVFAKPAQDFAAEMNPIQEKTLQSVGAALELVGEYIALVNHSGQVYAAADRQSLFPPPPPNGVSG
ncbi:MAG TPA: hypothetical protein VGP70_19980 [Actinomadura sp.]|nr:hypothetical protein [Actinomadura sp.]